MTITLFFPVYFIYSKTKMVDTICFNYFRSIKIQKGHKLTKNPKFDIKFDFVQITSNLVQMLITPL